MGNLSLKRSFLKHNLSLFLNYVERNTYIAKIKKTKNTRNVKILNKISYLDRSEK